MHAPTRDIYTFPTRRSSDLPTFSGTCLLKGQGAAVNPTRIRTVARQLAGPPPRGAALTADADLLTRFLDRHDEAAFGDLVARHLPAVRAVCRSLLRDQNDADDAIQA